MYFPFLVMEIVYLLYRFGVFSNVSFETRGKITFAETLNDRGVSAIIDFSIRAVRDFFFLVVGVWQNTVSSKLLHYENPFDLFSVGVAILCVAGLTWLLTRKWF